MFKQNPGCVKREAESFPDVEAFVGAALRVAETIDGERRGGEDVTPAFLSRR